ncbi:MAG: DNA-processing protein DprA [Bacteroidales bacterium]|jgi:DNA processing protein|nr:DNA-processing protein DprA [Bacteroidales bacterium]
MDNRTSEIIHTIALTQIPTVGCILSQKLIETCGSAEAVFRESKKKLSALTFLSAANIDNLIHAKDMAMETALREMKFIEKNNVSVFLKKDQSFPKRLSECLDTPVILYGKGNLDLNPKRSVAIVGTRHLTEYGSRTAEKIVEELSAYGNIQIVSGLAAGVDTCVHQAALKYELPTVGVLGHGLQTLYPASNKKLSLSMQQNGGMLTEYISTTKGDAHNFPRRNRIIAGMSNAVVVVEAHEKGGALITATIGFSYNRDVFAVPGRIGDKASEGCNNLIKYNKAALITSGEDIVKMMMWDNNQKKDPSKSKQRQLMLDLNEEEQTIVNVLQEKEKLNIDELQMATSLNIALLTKWLLALEFKGIIHCLPGKRYRMNI